MEDGGLLMELAQELAELRARVAVLEANMGQTNSVAEVRFAKPMVEDVRKVMIAHCLKKGYCTDTSPEGFWDFYEANGWKIGKNKMKDWKAAARNWCRRNRRRENRVGSEAYYRHGL